MLKTIFLTALTLAIAIGGGAASVWYALDNVEGWGTLEIGAWTALPNYGTPDADPYSRARLARQAELALGRAEGLSFTAEEDSSGAPLRRECTYSIEGPVPANRFWTLYAINAAGRPIEATELRRLPALHSRQLLRRPDGSFVITVSGHPAPGNWLLVPGAGPMQLVMTFYDTPVASSATISDVELPGIARIGCDDD